MPNTSSHRHGQSKTSEKGLYHRTGRVTADDTRADVLGLGDRLVRSVGIDIWSQIPFIERYFSFIQRVSVSKGNRLMPIE